MDFARGYDKALERRMDAEQYADFQNFNGTPRVIEAKVQSRAGRSIDLKSVLGVRDKSLDCGVFRWVDGGSLSKYGDEVCSQFESNTGMEKIIELESDFGDLVGCVSELKDLQVAETSWLKLTSQAELRQLKEKIRCLEEAECKRELKMDHLHKIIALHSAMFCIMFAALCYLAFGM
ncbi:hypothetical protein ACLOJK_017088 [Asimina triloba]